MDIEAKDAQPGHQPRFIDGNEYNGENHYPSVITCTEHDIDGWVWLCVMTGDGTDVPVFKWCRLTRTETVTLTS